MKVGAQTQTLCWSLALFLVVVASCDDAETSSATDTADASDTNDDTAADSGDDASDTIGDTAVDSGDDASDANGDTLADAADLTQDEADETPDTPADVPIDVRENDVLYINEVVATPMPDEADWIEIYNPSDETVSLGGWSITDVNPEHVLVIAAGTEVSAGGFLVLERNSRDHSRLGWGLTTQSFYTRPMAR